MKVEISEVRAHRTHMEAECYGVTERRVESPHDSMQKSVGFLSSPSSLAIRETVCDGMRLQSFARMQPPSSDWFIFIRRF